jgi:hypothetical protein
VFICVHLWLKALNLTALSPGRSGIPETQRRDIAKSGTSLNSCTGFALLKKNLIFFKQMKKIAAEIRFHHPFSILYNEVFALINKY